jgi:hypothetical protein
MSRLSRILKQTGRIHFNRPALKIQNKLFWRIVWPFCAKMHG